MEDSSCTDAESTRGGEEPRKLHSSRFKGVVPQPNGRWGAQIYEKHQRVWLGTFDFEQEAAKAYDVAVQRFRGRDGITNFKPAAADARQASFLSSRSKAEIVDMLRTHTYNDELKRKRFEKMAVEHLFEKTVTLSDVGKLNRLIIPKHQAAKHLPLVRASNSKGVVLHLQDTEMKVWRFRYSYWNSSQSYVLTKGWNRFVNQKNLKAGDTVTFQRSTGSDQQLYIHCKTKHDPNPEPHIFRLFGVDIFSTINNNNNNRNNNHKEMEFLGKQQRFIHVL